MPTTSTAQDDKFEYVPENPYGNRATFVEGVFLATANVAIAAVAEDLNWVTPKNFFIVYYPLDRLPFSTLAFDYSSIKALVEKGRELAREICAAGISGISA